MKSSQVFAVALLLAAHGAHAQFRCDCTAIVDTCTAEVAIRGTSIEVTTDRPQCARVDYFVDGQPFVSLTVDGEDRRDWVARTASPRIIVQSCQVCRENPSTAAQAVTLAPRSSADEGGSGDAGLQPLIEITPTYPPAALARRASGHVDVEFTVTPQGEVQNPRVAGAEPAGLFDQAALAAVQRFRYPSAAEREPQTVQRRIEFRPPPQAAAPAPRTAAAAAGATGPRNQCVRQDAVYNFGELVEVGLLNACDEPLLVYSCAEGTGRNAGRWSCTDSEQQASLLAPPGGQAPAPRAAANGAPAYSYVENFIVTRAPNSEYWWVACLESDAQCRSSARQWTRAVAGQPAAVDPQDRASLTLARSY